MAVCLLCVTEEESGLKAKMLIINPDSYPSVLGTEQTLTIPKDKSAGTWNVIIPAVDSDGEPICQQHTYVFVKYAESHRKKAVAS